MGSLIPFLITSKTVKTKE